MNFTILVPHYKQGQATAHAVYQLIKNKGKHNIDIVVIDNSNDDSINHILLTDLVKSCSVVRYPKNKLQSHGIAFDYAILNGHVQNDYFITIESDSFPTKENWLDDYQYLAQGGAHCAGSLLQLSGGQYVHPCGAMYKTSVWHDAFAHIKRYPFHYFPNMVMKEGFQCHTMVRKTAFKDFIREFGMGHRYEPASGYIGLTIEQILEREEQYSPTKGPFHNGMGALQESIHTYGQRNIYTGVDDMKVPDQDVILRIGYEPGQWLSYFLLALGYTVAKFDTEVKWLPGREGQNQEYTITETGFKHLWGISSFHKSEDAAMKDVIDFKAKQISELYEAMPSNYKLC